MKRYAMEWLKRAFAAPGASAPSMATSTTHSASKSRKTESEIVRKFETIESRNNWPQVYMKLRLDSDRRWTDLKFKCARKPQNLRLNRYRDVLPYDHSRVKLSGDEGDYINASLVTVAKAERTHILCQGPLPDTAAHFWQMIWEQDSPAIIMLNRVIEKNVVKCHQYFPSEDGDKTKVFDGKFEVELTSELASTNFIKRVFYLRNLVTEESRNITHYQYVTWPDFGVPSATDDFLEFLLEVRKSECLCLWNRGPTTIHCSAGIGRSGSFVVVDAALVLAQLYGPDSVDVLEMVIELRRYRMGLIQTADQLRFSWSALVDALSLDKWKELRERSCTNQDRPTSSSSPSKEEPPSPLSGVCSVIRDPPEPGNGGGDGGKSVGGTTMNHPADFQNPLVDSSLSPSSVADKIDCAGNVGSSLLEGDKSNFSGGTGLSGLPGDLTKTEAPRKQSNQDFEKSEPSGIIVNNASLHAESANVSPTSHKQYDQLPDHSDPNPKRSRQQEDDQKLYKSKQSGEPLVNFSNRDLKIDCDINPVTATSLHGGTFVNEGLQGNVEEPVDSGVPLTRQFLESTPATASSTLLSSPPDLNPALVDHVRDDIVNSVSSVYEDSQCPRPLDAHTGQSNAKPLDCTDPFTTIPGQHVNISVSEKVDAVVVNEGKLGLDKPSITSTSDTVEKTIVNSSSKVVNGFTPVAELDCTGLAPLLPPLSSNSVNKSGVVTSVVSVTNQLKTPPSNLTHVPVSLPGTDSDGVLMIASSSQGIWNEPLTTNGSASSSHPLPTPHLGVSENTHVPRKGVGAASRNMDCQGELLNSEPGSVWRSGWMETAVVGAVCAALGGVFLYYWTSHHG